MVVITSYSIHYTKLYEYFDGNLTTDSLTISTTSGEGVGSHFVPKFDNAYDLGNTTYQWHEIWINATAHIE